MYQQRAVTKGRTVRRRIPSTSTHGHDCLMTTIRLVSTMNVDSVYVNVGIHASVSDAESYPAAYKVT